MADRKAGDDVVVLEPGELSETTGAESESGPRLQENGKPVKKKKVYRVRFRRQQPYWLKSPVKEGKNDGKIENLVGIPEDPELEDTMLALDS